MEILGESVRVKCVHFNYVEGWVAFVRDDDKELKLPLDVPTGPGAEIIARGAWFPGGRLVLTTADGDGLLLEVSSQQGGDMLGGRRVVYLDLVSYGERIRGSRYDRGLVLIG